MNHFGSAIKILRTTLGLNQEKFGKEVGVKRSCVSKWENGLGKPSAKNYVGIVAVAKKTKLNIDWSIFI